MQVRIQFQGTESSPWMDQLIRKKVCKLNRYLRASSTVLVTLKADGKCFKSTICIQDRRQDFTFSAIGYNLYESFSITLDMAVKSMSDHHKKLKARVHRKFAA
ncbi:MAG: HPF/RaiA family ribosome-associated protein [Bacteriovoracia bacterium]